MTGMQVLTGGIDWCLRVEISCCRMCGRQAGMHRAAAERYSDHRTTITSILLLSLLGISREKRGT
jgi:hypothetical protein